MVLKMTCKHLIRLKLNELNKKSIDKYKEIISIIKLRHSIQFKQKELNWIALKLKFKHLIQYKFKRKIIS